MKESEEYSHFQEELKFKLYHVVVVAYLTLCFVEHILYKLLNTVYK